MWYQCVALRKESVDRNASTCFWRPCLWVALRKESVDRNYHQLTVDFVESSSLSARRAWIEICCGTAVIAFLSVALRKESVDRNLKMFPNAAIDEKSLSARRAWIEIRWGMQRPAGGAGRSPQGERG